jgi:mRNA interferase RelE/StbE
MSVAISHPQYITKDVRKLPKPVITKLMTAIDDLSKEPRPDVIRKLTASQETYRVRVGDYQIIYKIFDKQLVIEIIIVRDRKEAYK